MILTQNEFTMLILTVTKGENGPLAIAMFGK